MATVGSMPDHRAVLEAKNEGIKFARIDADLTDTFKAENSKEEEEELAKNEHIHILALLYEVCHIVDDLFFCLLIRMSGIALVFIDDSRKSFLSFYCCLRV